MLLKIHIRLFTVFCWLVGHLSFAQQFGNEWINYQQTYYKIPVAQKGVYRLTLNDLKQAGLPITTLNPVSIQMFFRGEEQAIFIQGESDNKLDDGDFIEFYGEANDGTQDSLLYIPHSAQPHKIYNLYSDTTAYFLTWRLDGQRGKRMEFYQQINTQNLVPEAYHQENLLVSNIASQNYIGMSEGLMYPLGISGGAQQSYYDYGEGWTGAELNKNRPFIKRIDLENVYKQGPNPVVELHLMGRDHRQHLIEVRVGAQRAVNRLLDTLRFGHQNAFLFQRNLSWTDIAADSNRVYVTTTSLGALPQQSDDVYSVTYYRLKYAQHFNFQGKTQKYFYLLPNIKGASYVELPNATTDTRLFDITDKNSIIRVGANLDNGTLKTIITQTQQPRILLATRQILKVPTIIPIKFRDINPTKHNYLIVTHALLKESAKNFAAYRASATGGKYDTLVVEMAQLINQFNYGEFSPLAIRRFVQFMAAKGTPKFLFIIGRTEQVDFNRNAPNRAERDMIPTWGWPGSDNLFSHGLQGQPPLIAGIPTGRLWTDKPEIVLNYLEKVRQHEATPTNAFWRKNILHLSGGISPFEQAQFLGIMNNFKQKAQGTYLGAKVKTITKKTDEPVEYVGIANEINAGAGVVTLFGHSSLSVTDIDIGFVSNDILGYRNKGKYPMVFANGCVVGNFTFGGNTYPFDWIGAKDRGAILFLAHSNVAFVYSLREYAQTFYETVFADSSNFNRPFGEIQQKITKKFLAKFPEDPIYKADAQQMSLQGDPAVVLFPFKQPDYTIQEQNIMVRGNRGQPLSSLTDSLEVQFVVTNVGLYRSESVPVKLTRLLKDGTVISYEQNFKSIAYQDTLLFKIPNERNQTGINRFEIQINPNQQLAEISITNNNAAIELTIPALGAYPLLPSEYAVISTTENNVPMVTLVAQHIENSKRTYLFEIDTTANFNSAYRRSQRVEAASLPIWKLSLLNQDTTTYYWRVSYADRPIGTDNIWSNSSFTYIKNATDGWVQRQPQQFTKANVLDINFSATAQPTWSYRQNELPIKATLTGASVGGFNQGWQQTQLTINNILFVAGGNCTTFDAEDRYNAGNNIVAVALRQNDLQAYSVIPNLNCGNPPYVMNTLRDRAIINNELLDKWVNTVPQGDWVVMMTIGNVQFDNWPAATKAKLKEIGLTDEQLKDVKSGRPYLFIGQKGAKAIVKQLSTDAADVAPSLRTLILDNFKIVSPTQKGSITSPLIGAASKWGVLKNKIIKNTTQLATIDVIGVGLNGKEDVLIPNQNSSAIALTSIDAVRYPFLRLKLNLQNSDPNQPLPAQLTNWLVTYTGVAEGTAQSNQLAAITLQEGESFTVNTSFKNITEIPFQDSIVVQQSLFAENSNTQTITRNLERLAANQQVSYGTTINTIGKAGNNRLIINYNPRVQPEQNYSNNVVNIPFVVMPDRLPPILEVTFDGRRIKDGDIVSGSPFILVHLKDENKFLFKRDTVGIELFLQTPTQNSFRRINFNNSTIKFIPADNQNLAKIHYTPTLADGKYSLRVQGADAKGNQTGVYQIAFQVKSDQQLVSAMASPNPFRNLLRFNFDISGKEPPTETNIIISDIIGRVVKKTTLISQIGNNEWIWNVPTDLAEGVYFYELQVSKDGKSIPSAESVQTNGKIILMK